MTDPLERLSLFQERVQARASEYEHEGIVGAAEQIGALPERIANQQARLVEIGAQRLRAEQIRQQMEMMSQEMQLRQQSAQTDLMESTAREQLNLARKRALEENAETDRMRLMQQFAGVWFETGDGKTTRMTQLRMTPQGRPKMDEITSTDPKHLELARRHAEARAQGRTFDPLGQEKLDLRREEMEARTTRDKTALDLRGRESERRSRHQEAMLGLARTKEELKLLEEEEKQLIRIRDPEERKRETERIKAERTALRGLLKDLDSDTPAPKAEAPPKAETESATSRALREMAERLEKKQRP